MAIASAPTSNNSSLQLGVELSADELAFILGALNINAIGGFVVPDQNEEQFITARQKLANRHFISFHEEQLDIDERIVALVAAGAVSSRAINIRHEIADGGYTDHWFYFTPHFHVYHSSPHPNTHQFQTIETSMEILAILTRIMALPLDMDDPPTREAAVEIPRDAYQEARDKALLGNVKDAADILQAYGVAANIALHMFKHEGRYEVTLCVIENAAASAAGFLVLPISSALWMVEPGQEAVRVYPVVGAEVLDHVADLLESTIV